MWAIPLRDRRIIGAVGEQDECACKNCCMAPHYRHARALKFVSGRPSEIILFDLSKTNSTAKDIKFTFSKKYAQFSRDILGKINDFFFNSNGKCWQRGHFRPPSLRKFIILAIQTAKLFLFWPFQHAKIRVLPLLETEKVILTVLG